MPHSLCQFRVDVLLLLCTFQPAQPLPLPTASELDANPILLRRWTEKLTAEASTRSRAMNRLAQGGDDSFPLLRRLVDSGDADLSARSFEALREMGPRAIPLLAELLESHRVAVRWRSIDLLIDLSPETNAVQAALARALSDKDAQVAGDAARALGSLGELAAPSTTALLNVLAHRDVHVRIYVAETLASIGPKAAIATEGLRNALRDPIAGVRWAACEALAGIGPAAGAAVPQLIDATKDQSLYVRICAIGALGSIGPAAEPARPALMQLLSDATLRADAEWALHRITGVRPENAPKDPAPSSASDPPVALTGTLQVPQTSALHPPTNWDIKNGRNIAWSADLGDGTFGRPVLSGDTVFIGTSNTRRINPKYREDCGVLLALRAADGAFLWQDLAPRLDRGLREFLLPSTTSAPYVENDRLYYVTAECQLRCLDTQGFRDGENDGPYQDERFRDQGSADIAWELDLCGQLGVFPHEACNSEVLPLDDLLIICTSNGRNEAHTRVPAPRAPSLVAVGKTSGQVVWSAVGAGPGILHGQWCSPTTAHVNGRVQVLLGGGDGWLRAYNPLSGREIWSFDGNPMDAAWRPRAGAFSRSEIIASPISANGLIIFAMGQDPSHGNGPSLLHAIRPDGQGIVRDTGCVWTSREIGRVVGTPVADDGLVYVADLGGVVSCFDSRNGDLVWKHDTDAPIWGCLLLAGDNLYVGNEDGLMTVLRAGRHKHLLTQIEMKCPLYSRPAVSDGELFLATARRLFLIRE